MESFLKILSPINDKKFDETVHSSGLGSLFVTTSWAKVLFKTYGYSPYFFSLIRDGNLEGIMPLMEVDSIYTGKRAVSLPFSDCCEPAINNKTEFNRIFEEIVRLGRAKGWKYLEFRGGDVFLSCEPIFSTYYQHKIEITKDEIVNLKMLRDSTRRNIKKSIKSGVTVELGSDYGSTISFYELHKKTRKRHGVPPQPIRFFKNIYKYLIRYDKGILMLARYDNKIISAAVVLLFGDEAIYKYVASDDKYHKFRPNNLMLWETIKWCSLNGFTKLNLGRTDVGSSGLLQFKRGWGGEESLVNYYRYDIRRGAFVTDGPKLSTKLKKIFQLTPVPILTRFGEIAYKHIG